MSNFRIYIYLKFKYFCLSFLTRSNTRINEISKILNKITNKKKTILTSQLRVGFFLVLKYLLKEKPKKKEIILNSYNLPEMVNICKNLNLNIVYTKLNENIFLSKNDLKKKITKNTLAVVITNMFNTTDDIIQIKKICSKKNIPLIEDNAIYFGNYIKKNKRKIFSGSFGDYSLHSFNIMKSISALYGGSVSTNDKKFIKFANKEMLEFKKFSLLKYINQCFIFIFLKSLSFKIIYSLFFFRLIKIAHRNNLNLVLSLVYPSLKFKKALIPKNYYTNISSFSINMIFYQLNDTFNTEYNHDMRRKNNIYYSQKLFKKKIKPLKYINIKEQDFQNFNDFPIIVKDKIKLMNYLFNRGIETKAIQYVDCHKLFKGKNSQHCSNFENKILCLPNHIKISEMYIDYVVNCIDLFYKKY